MERGIILKNDIFNEDWFNFSEANPYSQTCQLVGKNGKLTLNTFILASLSPFLKELLSSLPPNSDGCIILPDIDWEDISQFLKSLSKYNQTISISKPLADILAIKWNKYTPPSFDAATKNAGEVVDTVNNIQETSSESKEYDTILATENENIKKNTGNNRNEMRENFANLINSKSMREKLPSGKYFLQKDERLEDNGVDLDNLENVCGDHLINTQVWLEIVKKEIIVDMGNVKDMLGVQVEIDRIRMHWEEFESRRKNYVEGLLDDSNYSDRISNLRKTFKSVERHFVDTTKELDMLAAYFRENHKNADLMKSQSISFNNEELKDISNNVDGKGGIRKKMKKMRSLPLLRYLMIGKNDV